MPTDSPTLFPAPRLVAANCIRLAVYEQAPAGAAQDVPVVLLHGFPECAFSWRHQLPALAAAGWRAIAYDGRGYGRSDAPDGIGEYTMDKLTGDFAGLLDALGIDKAFVVGHDWGALVLWSLPFYAADRLAGLIALNVPFRERPPADPIALMNATYGPDNYISFFQAPGVAEDLWQADVARTMRFFYRRALSATDGTLKGTGAGESGLPKLDFQTLFQRSEADWPGECFLSEDELAAYVAAFERSGFAGPLNWYRNFSANWRAMETFQPPGAPPPRIDVPSLMILAENDPVLPPQLAAGMEAYFDDLETHLVRGSGHWTQQEKPDEVSGVILDWLNRHA